MKSPPGPGAGHPPQQGRGTGNGAGNPTVLIEVLHSRSPAACTQGREGASCHSRGSCTSRQPPTAVEPVSPHTFVCIGAPSWVLATALSQGPSSAASPEEPAHGHGLVGGR